MQQHQQTPTMHRPLNLTSDQIQKYLNENKELILAILEHQNLGKFAECASYRSKLQENLVYLSNVADWQQAAAQMPMSPPLESSHSPQPSQPAMLQQETAPFSPNFPRHQSNQLQLEPLSVRGQQFQWPQMGMRPNVSGNSFQVKHSGGASNSGNIQDQTRMN